MSYQSIANLIPAMSSLNLVSHNIKASKKDKIDTEDMLEMGVTNVVGLSLIKAQAGLIGGL